MAKTKRTITAEDLEASRKLRAIWDSKQKTLGLNQDEAADKIGVSQSAFSQMLRGKMAIPTEAAMRLAVLLGVHVGDFRPDLISLVDGASKRSPLDQVILDLARLRASDTQAVINTGNLGRYATLIEDLKKDMEQRQAIPMARSEPDFDSIKDITPPKRATRRKTPRRKPATD